MENNKKGLRIAGLIASAAVVILAAMQLLGIWPDAGRFYVPLMGLVLVLMALQNWKRSRLTASLCMVAGVVILGISLFVWVASFLQM